MSNVEKKSVVLELESHFFRELLGRLEDPVFVKNDKHQWIFTNSAFEELLGCNDLIGKTDADFLPEDQVGKFYAGDDEVIKNQYSLTQEEQIGDECFALVKKIPVKLPDGSMGLFGIIFDISEYRKVQLEVEKLRLANVQARTDPLTGLANRRYLEDYFTQQLENSQSSQKTIGLLHIDLDHFKEFNDTKGHLLGDRILVHLATTLRKCLEPEAFIARIGGDEFVAVICGKNMSQLKEDAQKIIAATAQPMALDGDNYTLSISVGLAFDNKGELTLMKMLKHADLALYRAKHNGRGRYEQFTSSIQKEHDEYRERRDDFRVALDQQQFIPYYQPQFNAKTLELVGVEALARWNHPEQGILPPDAFLDIAISEKRLIDLDQIILRKAVQDSIFLGNAGITLPALSINVSPQSLDNPDFVEFVRESVPVPDQVCFELVESMLLDEPNSVTTDKLNEIRDMGITLDIDDFGSGRTSLLGILEIKPDRLKIDKRLVIPMTESERHYEFVRTIIQVAMSLGIQTVAEGVESENHRVLLNKLGCSVIQGFGFARPMPLHELQAFVQRQAAA